MGTLSSTSKKKNKNQSEWQSGDKYNVTEMRKPNPRGNVSTGLLLQIVCWRWTNRLEKDGKDIGVRTPPVCRKTPGRHTLQTHTLTHTCRSVHTDWQPAASLGWVSCMGCRPGCCQIMATSREKDTHQAARLASERADKRLEGARGAGKLHTYRCAYSSMMAPNVMVFTGEHTHKKWPIMMVGS